MDSLALKLARWATGLTPSDMPSELVELAKLRILDTVGLVLVGVRSATGRIALETASKLGGSGESILIGSGVRVSASAAVLAHAVAAHCYDFDDTLTDSVVHPGSVIVPVALATGEATGADGVEILCSIGIGYEIAARLGRIAGRSFHANGFHASGIIGPLAAAVAASRIYRLTVEQTASAMGLAASMSGGLLEFLSDGSWSKSLHLGWAAHGGIIAAQLAGAGFAGPVSALDGRYGLYNCFLGKRERSLANSADGLGTQWLGSAARFKYYPGAHVTQPYVEAAIRIKAEHALVLEDIRSVRCHVAPWCAPLVCEPRDAKLRPRNREEAIASLYFLVAAAIVQDDLTVDSVSSGSLAQRSIAELARRVEAVPDSKAGRGFDGVLEIETRDGRRYSEEVTLPPASPERVRAKFLANSAAQAPAWRSSVQEAVFRLEKDPARLFEVLAAADPPDSPNAPGEDRS